MIVLDTNAITLLDYRGSAGSQPLFDRLERAAADGEVVTTTVISYEEQVKGRLSVVSTSKTSEDRAVAYRLLQQTQARYCELDLLPYTADCDTRFRDLRRTNPRLDKFDLKIAAVTLVHDATLLTRNLRDFKPIDGLKLEGF